MFRTKCLTKRMKGKNKYFKVTLTKTLLTKDQPLFENNIYIYLYIYYKQVFNKSRFGLVQ